MKYITTNVTLPEELREKLRRFKKEKRVSFSVLIRSLLTEFFEKYEQNGVSPADSTESNAG